VCHSGRCRAGCCAGCIEAWQGRPVVWATWLVYPGRPRGLLKGLGLTQNPSICFRCVGIIILLRTDMQPHTMPVISTMFAHALQQCPIVQHTFRICTLLLAAGLPCGPPCRSRSTTRQRQRHARAARPAAAAAVCGRCRWARPTMPTPSTCHRCHNCLTRLWRVQGACWLTVALMRAQRCVARHLASA
jgi:hypothetical protein